MGRKASIKLLVEVFTSFFKIGLFTFGGGYAMIPIIERDIVDKKRWMAREEFIEMLALVQSVPGPISINTSIYVGYKVIGWAGAIAAILGIIIPSFVIILLIAIVFTDISSNPVIERVFKGIRPAVVALIAAPIVRMAKAIGITWKTAWIPIAAALSIWLAGVSPVYIILATICISILWNMFKKPNNK